MSTSRNTFVAAYDGRCTDCGDDIFSGDEIAYLDDEVVCADCWHEATDTVDEWADDSEE